MATYFLSSASGVGGAGNGSSWANAYLTIDALLARTAPTIALNDIIFIGDDHVENIALVAAKTLAVPPSGAGFVSMICVDHTKDVPGDGDQRNTAQLNYTGNFAVTFQGNWGYVYGLNVKVAASGGAVTTSITVGTSSNSNTLWENCVFHNGSTTTNQSFTVAGTSTLIGCTMKWQVPGRLSIPANPIYFQDCSFEHINNGNIAPPNWIQPSTAAHMVMENCDLSKLGSGTLIGPGFNMQFAFKRCKLNAGVVLASTQSSNPWAMRTDFIQCDHGGNLARNDRVSGNGTSLTNLVIARKDGMVDGGVPVSHRVITNTVTKWSLTPFYAFPIAFNNSVVGSPINITLEFLAEPIADYIAVPNNDDIWFDVEHLGVAGTVRGVRVSGTKSNVMAVGTPHTPSNADWTAGTVPERTNNTAVAGLNLRKVASNPGRVFICSVPGTTAASEPAGYVTAVDGDSVIDGSATFKAMWRFKQTITITPQAAGVVYVQPKMAKTSATAFIYIDPMVTVN